MKMPELKSKTAIAIEQHYSKQQKPVDHPTLRCSKIGEECERSLWYDLRWTTPLERHEGRVERLFQTGHREEQRMIADLRAIGMVVYDKDPNTGMQFSVRFCDGLFNGSCDGVGDKVPGHEKKHHLLEFKTHNDKSFQSWKRDGVEKSKPTHFFQMQIYMHGLKLERALYVAHNKNTDEVEVERIKYQPAVAKAIIEKADRIIASPEPPPKMESFACRWCRHEKICRYDDWPRANCRTCIEFDFREGKPFCNLHSETLTMIEQRAGCAQHLYIPPLVPGEQVDADEKARTITYTLRVTTGDEVTYVDGKDVKPEVPELAE